MNTSKRALCFGLLGASWLLAPYAAAAPPTTKECLAANEQSHRLDNENKLIEVRKASLVCAAESCPEMIRNDCLRRVETTSASIPTIIFELKDASGRDVSTVDVTVDGQLLANQLTGVPLEVNPGAHTFTFTIAGEPTIERQFVLQTSQKNRHEVITVQATPQATPAADATASAAAVEPPPPPAPARKDGDGQRTAGLIVGGLGAVGVVVGGIYGSMAKSRKTKAEEECPGTQCETSRGVSLWQDAKKAGNVSTVAFVAAGVGLAVGAVLWFTASPDESAGKTAQTFVGIGPGTVQLKGSF